MVRHAMKKGIRFDYLLVDSWFTCADLIRFITSRHLECHLIGMLKMGKTRYRTEAGNLNAPVIIDRLKKEKSVRYSRKLNCYYAHMDAEYANRKSGSSSAKEAGKGHGTHSFPLTPDWTSLKPTGFTPCVGPLKSASRK